VIPTYVCPSSPRASNPFKENGLISEFTGCVVPPYWAGASDYTALNCYSCCLAVYYNSRTYKGDPQAPGNSPCNCPTFNCTSRAGVLNSLSIRNGFGPVSIEMIVDGTSTTIFCAELAGRPDLWVRGVKKIAQPCICGHGPGNLVAVEDGGSPPPANAGGCWGCLDNAYNQVFGSTFAGGTVFNPAAVCFINCTNQAKMGLYSFHPGSCGLAMCDGSVHMVSENLSVLVFCRLLTYAGRAPVTDSF
jgi:Protein of unknown function (DUF1559)